MALRKERRDGGGGGGGGNLRAEGNEKIGTGIESTLFAYLSPSGCDIVLSLVRGGKGIYYVWAAGRDIFTVIYDLDIFGRLIMLLVSILR